MNPKSLTFKVYHATPLYQPNGDNKAVCFLQLVKLFQAVANDDFRYAESDSSTCQICSRNNRIRLCCKIYSSATDDILTCQISPMFDYAIPLFSKFPGTSVFLPDATQSFHLVEGIYHIIHREPFLITKNASDLHGVSVSMIPCQVCNLCHSCQSTITLNQGDLVLEPDMDYCSKSPENIFAIIELIPSLEQVMKHVPRKNNVLHA